MSQEVIHFPTIRYTNQSSGSHSSITCGSWNAVW